MKKLLLSVALLAPFFASANSGGPDGFGYIWKDSNDSAGPAYQWFDITTIGSPINGLADDNFVGPIQVGFQFPYYWTTESKVWVGSNGYLGFGPGNIAANFPLIPDASGINNYITGLMADLTFLGAGNTGQAFYYANADSFCVEYLNVPYWDPNFGFTGSNTFEIILNKNDSSITVNFMSCTGASISNLSVGIENSIGTMGLQPLTTQPAANYTIKYYFPSNVPQVTDASVVWNYQNGNGGVFIGNNSAPQNMFTQVKNSGNTAITPIIATGEVRSLFNALLYSGSDTSIALVPGQVQTLTYPTPYGPTALGTYKYITHISGVSGDLIPVNDSIIQEIVVVDTAAQFTRLCYTNNHTDLVQGSISWGGGMGGVGVYLKPPKYPAKILNTNYILTSSPASGPAFYAKIYDDNGPGGSPGTLLDSVLVDGSQISSGITFVPVSNPNLIITSGGFYVNWDMASTSVSIGQSLTPPFSRQSYEVISSWSNYRDYQTTDFFIGSDVNFTFVGIDENERIEGVRVYPVPAQDRVTFEFTAAAYEPMTITIADITGKVIETRTFNPMAQGSILSVDLSAYAQGTYFYTILSGSKVGTGKLMKTE